MPESESSWKNNEKVYSYVIFGALVQTLIFREGASGHFGFSPMAENASIYFRWTGGNIFFKWSIAVKSNVKPK